MAVWASLDRPDPPPRTVGLKDETGPLVFKAMPPHIFREHLHALLCSIFATGILHLVASGGLINNVH